MTKHLPYNLTPQQIGDIRIKTGLDTVDAGRLIGGGPRAWEKYENGTVTPSAALNHLMHVVNEEPAVLGVLRDLEKRRQAEEAPKKKQAT